MPVKKMKTANMRTAMAAPASSVRVGLTDVAKR